MTVSGLPQGAIPLRERRSLAEQWKDYASKVIPADASQAQVIETRRAFYAGANTIYALLMNDLDAAEEPTQLDVAYMQSLDQELRDYLADIRAGRA